MLGNIQDIGWNMRKYNFIDILGKEEIREFATYAEAARYAVEGYGDHLYRWYQIHHDACDWWVMAPCCCGASEVNAIKEGLWK